MPQPTPETGLPSFSRLPATETAGKARALAAALAITMAVSWTAMAAPRPAAAQEEVTAAGSGAAALTPPSGELMPIRIAFPFGTAVAISGDTAAVTGSFRGHASVYVFVRGAQGWAEQIRLGDPAGDDPTSSFGRVLALSGDTLAIGAAFEGAPDSSVYVYVRSAGLWTQQAHLHPPSAAAFGFGAALALASNTLVVGVPGAGDGATAGAAFLYTRSGTVWSRHAILYAKTPANGDRFGRAVAVAHQRAIVGGTGFAEVFEPKAATWQRAAVLHGSGTGTGFGSSVAASNETAAVGDPGNSRVSVFIRNSAGWFLQANILRPAGATEFGNAISLSQDALAVGAPGTTTITAAESGAVHVYVRLHGHWVHRGAFGPAAPASGDRFGSAVAVSLHTAVVGATSDSPEPRTAWLLEGLDHP